MSRSIEELERALTVACARTLRAVTALEPKHRGGEIEEFAAARNDQLRLERELALARGDEAAIEIAWDPPWSGGAPMPHVVSNGYRTFLIYLVATPQPGWDGRTITVVDPTAAGAESLALVELKRCYAYKFGGPNDEVFHGHPLYGKGLVMYGAHEISNSRWLEAERRINAVHPQYRVETWTTRKHYALMFHDDCFECLASGFAIERLECSFAAAVALASGRLLE